MSDETATRPERPICSCSAAPAPGRWWAAVGAGVVLCGPIGWLLSYGGGLPFFLGLFFYMLLGLVIGAVMYRVGLVARPVPVWNLRLGVAVVVLVGWGLSIWVEAYEFPADTANRTLRKFHRRPDGMTPDTIRQEAKQFVRDYLGENYPPGGTIGYMRWVLTSSEIAVKIEGVPGEIPLRFAANGGWWLFRVIASLGLFTYAVRSQVRVLREPDRLEPGAERPSQEP